MSKFIKFSEQEINHYKTSPQLMRVKEALFIDDNYNKLSINNKWIPDKDQPITGGIEQLRKYVRVSSVNYPLFDPREIEKIRSSSRGNRPFNEEDKEAESEKLFHESLTANQLNIRRYRESPTSVSFELNLDFSSV